MSRKVTVTFTTKMVLNVDDDGITDEYLIRHLTHFMNNPAYTKLIEDERYDFKIEEESVVN
jgi:hypothetical protein